MKCSVHKIKEYIEVDISVIAMDEDEASKFCEEIAKLIGTHVPTNFKCEITAQVPAENLQERYFCTITYEIESKKIDKTFDDDEITEKVKKLCENFNVEIDPPVF